MPTEWKSAEITAIFKKGDKRDPGNYRPVSLTSVICKVLESIIADFIREYMESNNFFSKCQHGFRQKRSCMTQLLEVMNDFSKLREENKTIDVIYLDFSKAFDTVPHKRLINKLSAYGIQDNLLNWITDFLSDRKQRVKVNSSVSDYAPVTSGIPQGSILGPLLFIIYINDLPEVVENICKIFADDTNLYGESSKHQSIQNDLFNLLEWSRKWLLSFNIGKCGALHIGNNNPQHDYTMDVQNKSNLTKVNSEKNVGVVFSPNLKFDEHITNIVKSTNQKIGLIKRSFTHLDKDSFVKIYKAIIRTNLEYGNVIWHPFYLRQIRLIEDVQRRATRILPALRNLSYQDRLRELKLPSLQYRRLRGDLIQTYKIVNELDNLDKDQFFTMNETKYELRNSSLKLQKHFCKSRIRSNYFSERVINHWNSLSDNTKQAPSLLTFKIRIDYELQHLAYQCD